MRISIDDSAVVTPWDAAPDQAVGLASEGGRYVLLTPATVERVVLSVSGESLPRLATFSDHRRVIWRKFELPAADLAGRPPVTETVVLKVFADADYPQTLRVDVQKCLSRPEPQHASPPPDEASLDLDHLTSDTGDGAVSAALPPGQQRWAAAAEAVDGLIHRQLELVNRLYDSIEGDSDNSMFFDHAGGGTPAWPLRRVVHAWRESDFDGDASRRDDEGIVKLSRQLARLLNDVCHHPRRYLTRTRRVLPAERVREVDATCVRWLARQPGPSGRTMVERVGVQQKAMGVVRYETADTVENRVVRDLIRRAKLECHHVLDRRTLREGPDDPVAVELAEFTGLLVRLERDSALADVRPTGGVPRPNHVISHDPRYRALWKAYMTLVNRQQQRDRTWRWRRRIWAEACSLGILAAMERLAPVASAWKSPVLIQREETCGRFFDPRTALGRWDLPDVGESGASLLWLDGHQLGQYHAPAPLPEQLLRLCPDGALLVRDGRKPDQLPTRIVGIWSMLGFDIEQDQLAERCRELATALRLVPGSSEIRGLLLQPEGFAGPSDNGDASPDNATECWTQPCLGLRLPIPVQRGEARIEAAIRKLAINDAQPA